MKKINIILILIIGVLVLGGCGKDDKNIPQNDFNAKVLGVGVDCGDTYLIQFYESAENVPNNDTKNVFYAINLPDEYKKKDLDIFIIFREPNDKEIPNCTMLDIAYPQIYVEKVQ